MSFSDICFPESIAYGSSGGPAFSTDIVTTESGHERRNSNWRVARARYNVAHGVKTNIQMEELIAFFRARKGRAYGFRFKDWSDYAATSEQLGIGDGSTTIFKLVKHYASGNDTHMRRITRPKPDNFTLYINEVVQASGYSLDSTSGIVTFDTAPAISDIITADFEFDVPVRFDTDSMDASLDAYGIHSWNNIPLIEIRE